MATARVGTLFVHLPHRKSTWSRLSQRGVGGRVDPGRVFVSQAACVVRGTHSINRYKGKKSRAAERPDERKPGGLSLIPLTAEVYGHR
jgi:hypothetical protein